MTADSDQASSTDALSKRSLQLSQSAQRTQRALGVTGRALLWTVASSSVLAVLFIFIFIGGNAIPFFGDFGLSPFFTSTQWEPPNVYGSLALFYGSALVTVGAMIVAVPLGVGAAICLSDILPFNVRQTSKPVIEVLAAIPSVAYGFFALRVFADLLSDDDWGGPIVAIIWFTLAIPFGGLLTLQLVEWLSGFSANAQRARPVLMVALGVITLTFITTVGLSLSTLEIATGVNALNASIILGVMTLPTIISVSEDALQAVSRDLREGSYALGSTRAETLLRVVIPAASSGIIAAIILGVMRAVGETMVVWMAAGNSPQVPTPFWDFTATVRTLTATIAAEMGEADQSTSASHYTALFALALALLAISFALNAISEWVLGIQRRRLGG